MPVLRDDPRLRLDAGPADRRAVGDAGEVMRGVGVIAFDVTVSVNGRDFHVTGDIAPEEPSHWSEWDGGYPGCPSGIEDAKICLVRGKREREIQEPANPTKAQEKAWSDFFYLIECAVFEVLDA